MEMALPSRARSFVVVLFFLASSMISSATGGIVGVDYGRKADKLMPPDKVVELLKANGIGAVSIYDADPAVLQAFSGSGIKVSVSLLNEELARATNPDWVADWVCKHVAAHYPSTQIVSIAVGNEVFRDCPVQTPFLVPVMKNVYSSLLRLGLADAIKVSSPVAFDAVENPSWPPSQAHFRTHLKPVLRQMLDFLFNIADSYFMVNLYPFTAYMSDPKIRLDFALGLPNATGEVDPHTHLTYYSLLDAQLDALYSAMAELGYGPHRNTVAASTTMEASSRQRGRKDVEVKETGHPSGGEGKGAVRRTQTTTTERVDAGNGTWNTSSLALVRGANMENAQAYNSNLIKRILSGKTGTPLHPDTDMDVYIFSLFDENRKPGPETEKHYGLFYPNGMKKYDVNFRSCGCGTGGSSIGEIPQHKN